MSTFCPNRNNSEYKELLNAFNGNTNTADLLWVANKGHNIDKTSEGVSSPLFNKILKLDDVDNDRALAFRYKAYMYTPAFEQENGRLDEEPKLEVLLEHVRSVEDMALSASAISELKDDFGSKYIIDGFTPTQAESVINVIVGSVQGQLLEQNEAEDSNPITLSKAYKVARTNLEKHQRELRAKDTKISNVVANNIQRVLDDWESFTTYATNRIENQQGFVLSDDNTYDEDLETSGGVANNNYNDKRSLSIDPKSGASTQLRRFFANIIDVKADQKPKANFLALKERVPFDQVYDSVIEILAGSDTDIDSLIARLDDAANDKPFLSQVAERIEEADSSIQNAIQYNMIKHYVEMNYARRVVREDGTIQLNVGDVNSASAEKRILKQWRSNYIAKDFVQSDESGSDVDVFVNTDTQQVKDILDAFDVLQKTTPTIEMVQSWLSSVGMDMSDAAVKSLIDYGIYYQGDLVSFDTLLGKNNVFDQIAKNFRNRGKTSLTQNDLFSDTAVVSLAKHTVRFSNNLYSNSGRDGEGKTRWFYSNNKHMINRLNRLKTEPNLVEGLLKLSFNSGSQWLRELAKDDSVLKDKLKITYADTYRDTDGRPIPIERLSSDDLLKYKLHMFQNQGKDYVIYNFLNTSDKKTVHQITAPRYPISLTSTGSLSKPTLDMLYDTLVLPELLRTINHQKRVKQVNLKGYNEGANIFYFIPELNDAYEIFLEDNNIEIGNDSIKMSEKTVSPDVLLEEFKPTFYKILNTHVNTLINNRIKLWQDAEIITDGGKVASQFLDPRYTATLNLQATDVAEDANIDTARVAAADMEINYLVANANMYMMFAGDPALSYKGNPNSSVQQQIKDTFENISKRLAGEAAPRQELANSKDEQFTMLYLQDLKMDSAILAHYEEILGKDSAQYKAIETTDAHGVTTLKEKVRILVGKGIITQKRGNELIVKHDRGDKLSKKELKIVLGAEKPVFNGNEISEEFDVDIKTYVKLAEITLLKQFTEGHDIDKLREFMEANDIDRSVYGSGIKQGNLEQPLNIWNSDGSIKDLKDIDSTLYTKQLDRRDFGIQNEVPFKEKGVINDGSQQRKLLFADILHVQDFTYKGKKINGKQLNKTFLDTYNNLYKLHYADFKDELLNEDGTVNNNKINEIILKEARERNYNINEIEGLKLDNNNFIIPIFFSPSASKFEALLNSLVENKIRKILVTGSSYVLAPQEGWKKTTFTEDEITNKDKNGIIYTKNYDAAKGLQPSSYDKDGKVTPDQVLVPFKFKDNYGNTLNIADFMVGNMLDVSKLPTEILDMFGYRIPTSAQNSMSYIEVVGFLPEAMGDIIIAPRDFIVRMGSDFDVDSLYAMSRATYVEAEYANNNKKPNEIEEEYQKFISTDNYSPKAKRDIIRKNIDKFDDSRGRKEFAKANNYFVRNDGTFADKIIRKSLRAVSYDTKEEIEALNDQVIRDILGSTEFDSADAKVIRRKLEIKNLHNRLLDIHIAVMSNSNKEVQARIKRPLSFGLMSKDGELYKAVVKAKGEKDFVSGLSEQYQTERYLGAREGKDGIGSFSMDSVYFAALQQSESPVYFYTTDETGKPVVQQIRFGDLVSNNLNEPKTNDKGVRTKIDVFSAFQNISVDNENNLLMDPLSVVGDNFNTIRTLVGQGFDEATIIPFISQPIISEYHKLISKLSKEMPYVKAKELAYITLFEKYDSGNKYTSKYDENADVSGTKLIELLATENKESESYRFSQLAILKKNMMLEDQGRDLRKVQALVNSDSVSIGRSTKGSSLIAAQTKLDGVSNLPYSTNIMNVEAIIGDYKKVPIGQDLDSETFLKLGYVKINATTYIRPRTINGMATVYALNTTVASWSKFFPYTNAVPSRVVDEIERLAGAEFNLNTSIERRIKVFNAMKSFVYTSLDTITDDAFESRSQLMYDKYTFDGINTEHIHMSVASILLDLRNKPIGQNAFLSRLQATPSKNSSLPADIMMYASTAENSDETAIYSAVADLLTSNEVIGTYNGEEWTTTRLMESLIQLMYLNGGVQSAVQYVKYIPPQYLIRSGIAKQLTENASLNNASLFGLSTGVRERVSFMAMQYFQHNVNELQNGEELDFIDPLVNEDGTINNDSLNIYIEGLDMNSVPSMIKYRNPTNKKFYPYLRVGNTYVILDRLGDAHGHSEYDAGAEVAKSMMVGNKTTTYELPANNPTLETTPIDNKKVKNVLKQSTAESYGLISKKNAVERTKDFLKTVIEKSTNSRNKLVAEALLANSSKLELAALQIDVRLSKGNPAQFNNATKVLTFNPDALQDSAELEKVMLHELVHSALNSTLINPKTAEEIQLVAKINGLFINFRNRVDSKKLQALVQKIERLKQKKDVVITEEEAEVIYAGYNIKEYVALALTSPDFQALLNETNYNDDISFWKKIVEYISQLFTGTNINENSELEAAMTYVLSLLETKTGKPAKNVVKVTKDSVLNPKNSGGISLGMYNYANLEEAYLAFKGNSNITNVQLKESMKLFFTYLHATNPEFVTALKNAKDNLIYVEFGNASDTKLYNTLLNQFKDRDLSITGAKQRSTVQDIIKRFKLKNRKGGWTLKTDPGIASHINKQYSGIKATARADGYGYVIVVEEDTTDFALSSGDSTDVNSNRFNKLIGNLRSRKKMLYQQIATANNNKDFYRVNVLEDTIADLNIEIDELTDALTVEEIAIFAKKDIDELEVIFSNDMTTGDLLYAKKLIHLWKNASEIFLNDAEKLSETISNMFSSIEGKINQFDTKLSILNIESMNDFVRERSPDSDVTEELSNKADISVASANVLDISRYGFVMLDLVSDAVKNANSRAFDEANKIYAKLDSLLPEVQAKLKAIQQTTNGTALYEPFMQKYNTGEKTGNIIYPYTQEFFETKKALFNRANESDNPAMWDNYFDWKHNNEILMDARLLAPPVVADDRLTYVGKFDEKAKAKHIAELKNNMGEYRYNVLSKRMEARMATFFEEFDVMYSEIVDNGFGSLSERQKRMKIWEIENSPYYYSNAVNKGKSIKIDGNFIKPMGHRFTYETPRKTNLETGEATIWNDSRFDTIANDETLSEFYEFMIDTFSSLHKYLPYNSRKNVQVNTLPTILKAVIEQFDEGGLKTGLASVYDKLIASTTEGSIKDTMYGDIDPITGEVDAQLEVKMLPDQKRAIDQIVEKGVLEFRIKTNSEPDLVYVQNLRRKATNEVAETKSFDLGKVIKAYSMAVLSYKHKSAIEDYVQIARNIINESRESRFTPKNEKITDPYDNVVQKSEIDSFKNLRTAYENYFKVFYGYAREVEGVSNIKFLTPIEKAEKKKYEDLLKELELLKVNNDIEDEEYTSLRAELELKAENVGGYIAASRVGDNLLQWMQLKGMGWNTFSAVANMGFGYISNLITAADGRDYTQGQLRKAYRMTWSSIGRNLTAHQLDKFDQSNVAMLALKIRAIMDKFDVLKDASNELYKTSKETTLNTRLKFLEAYNLQKRSEYLNQAPVMIAMMLNKKITDLNGEERTLWEAYDNEGNWNTQEFAENNEWSGNPADYAHNKSSNRFKNNLDQVIKKNHGNYDHLSPLAIKRKFLGRALAQFRTWMFEGWASRIESEKYDSHLEYTRKGRYRTISSLYFTPKVSNIETSGISNVVFTLNQLFRKATFRDTKFDDRFNEVDAANMRANLQELVIYAGLIAIHVLIKASLDDDDEDQKLYSNYLINMLTRMQTDITFYVNPQEQQALMKNLIPVSTLVTDLYEFIIAGGRFIQNDDTIATGIYSGDSRLLRETLQLMPLGTQAYRLYSTGQGVYRK